MTKKKRELIEILLDNITPDDWPEDAKWAAQDKKSWGKNKLMFYKQDEPPFAGIGSTWFRGNMSGGNVIQLPELCKNWSVAIVRYDQEDIVRSDIVREFIIASEQYFSQLEVAENFQ